MGSAGIWDDSGEAERARRLVALRKVCRNPWRSCTTESYSVVALSLPPVCGRLCPSLGLSFPVCTGRGGGGALPGTGRDSQTG
jgi:hypothetical protein